MSLSRLDQADQRLMDNKQPEQPSPGPWQHGEPFHVGAYPLTEVISISAGGAVLAHVNAVFDADANARLIAAAPDMLAALRLVERSFSGQQDYGGSDPHSVMIRTVRAALAKAQR